MRLRSTRPGLSPGLVLRILVWSGALGTGLSASVPATTWSSLGPAGVVSSVAPDPQNPATVYAALRDSGVWKTTDGGSTWAQKSTGLPLSGSFAIVVDPTNPLIVYASTGASGVFKTSTGGETWSAANAGLPMPSGAIAISPSTPSVLLVRASTALFQTRDAAASWQPVFGGGLPSNVVEAKFSPASSATIVARVGGLSPSDASIGLFRSSNGGASWTRLPVPLPRASLRGIGPFAIDPRNPAVLYVVTLGCAFSCYSTLNRSGDEGGTWTLITSPHPSVIVVDIFSGVTVSTGSSVYRSTDGGLRWTDFSDGLLVNPVHSFVQSGNRLYAATDQGVFVATPPPPPPSQFNTIPPCRLMDTRETSGPYGGPALGAGTTRIFTVGGRCLVPPTARSVSINATVTDATSAGYLALFPGGTNPPLASAITFRSGQTRANNGIVPLGGGGILSVLSGQTAGNTVHFILDVNGYFE